MQKTRRLLLASAIAAVTVGVLVVQYFVASQLAKADAINSTDFVMTIDTRKGTGNTFTVPTIGGGYNYTLVCGNGVVLTGQTGNATCSYATAGVYKVRIAGAFPRIYFDYRGDRFKVISIDQWGTNEWQNMEHAFDGAENLDVKATDKPRMGQVVSLAYMFRDAKSLKGEGADWQWDTKNVESLNSTFSGARQFNQNISSWNTSKVTDMDNTFTNAYEFNQPIQSWDVSKVNTMVAVLAYAKKFNQPIGEWNTTQLTDALLALAGAERFDQSLAHWDVRRLTDADRLLDGVKISTPNYDATLTSWQAQAVRGNVKLGGGNSNYCVAEAKRNDLIATKSWIITDAGKDCTAYTVTAVDYTGVTDVDENTTTGTVLGRLNSTDAVNSPQSDFTYTLDCTGAQNNLVAIDGNTIKLAQSPDYEQNATLEICVRATNKAGKTFDKHLTISVNNLYSVSYNANGADAGAPPASTGETLHSGDSVSVEANINGLAKTGHSFTGWNTAPNGAGTPYAPGANFHLTGDITLYAQWQVNNYTLHFDSKGGSNVPDQTVAFGAKATTPTAPTKTGHTFAGWYKEAGLVNAWNFATDTMPASDTTLYAKWTINQYKIHYDANTGTGGATPDTVSNYDTTVQIANNGFTKTGHSFTGWNTAPNGAGTPYAPGANFHLTGDITLYAQWQVNNYTLHFDSKGGSNVPDQTVAFGAKATTPTAPTKTGHTFAGWYKEAGLVNAWNFATDTMPASDTTLYAKWTINQYKIHYDANTGTGGATPDTVSNYDTTVQIANNGFTKTGHSFTGWNTAPNGAGTPYAPGANFHLTGDITLYAQWQVNNYTLHFDSKGGSNVPDQTVAFGAKATTPTAPTKTGHTFAGWYKEAGLVNAWNFATDTMPASDTTLYAKWTINQYKIHYDANTGTGGATPDTVSNYDTTVQIANNGFTKTGHSFTGWNTAPNGAGTPYAPGANFHLTGDITLYAQWQVNNYTLHFDSKGGSNVPDQTVAFGAKATTPTAPTKTGHTFAGWYKEAGLVNAWNFATDTMPASDTTLYAKWTINQYKIHYDANTGTGGATPDTVSNYDTTVQIANNGFTKTGHSFTGWNTAPNGAGTPYAPGANFHLTGDITLYAQWQVNNYTLHFDSKGGSNVPDQTVAFGAKATTPTAPTKTGHTFAGWYKEAGLVNAWNFATDTMPASDTTLYAKWTINQYKIHYDANTGTGGATPDTVSNYDTTVQIANNGFTKTGHSFTGWNTAPNGAGTPYAPGANFHLTGDITLYAQWQVNNYTLHFDSKGGSNVPDQTVAFGAKATTPTAPTKTGHTFAGWYKEAGLVNAWNFATDTMPASDTTLYAKWTINQYKIHYDANTGTGGATPDTVSNYDTTVQIANNGFTKTGHSFTGWNTAPNGAGTPYAPGANFHLTGDITLYAQWQVNNYTLHFDSKGGSNVPDQTVAFGAKATTPTAPTKTGHTFAGWYKEAGLVNAWNFATDTMPASDTTLYAKWTINQYKIHYDANTGTGGATPDTVSNYDTTVQIANNGFTKTGHSFTGWNTAPNGAGTPYAPGANFHLTGDITLYAQWQVNNYTLHFDSKGGSNVPDQTVAFGAKATTPTAPTKTGHTFAGWYKEAGLVNAWNFATDTMPASDTTLYAKWTINQYKIHYDANTGTGGATPDTVSNYDTTVQIANNGFTKTGHSFTGWNTAPNGAGTPYAPGANFHLTGDITLYAQWQDTQPPVAPAAAPDMTATSDTGDSDSDNITNKNKPVFKLVCTEVGSTLTLYVDGAANGTVNCANVGPVDMVPTAPLTEGNHSVTFKESDAAGNESPSSPALAVTIDTTAPAAPTVTMDPVTADNTINSVEAAAQQFIRGSVTGAHPGDKARLTINGVIYEATIDATGRFSVTVPGTELVSDPDRTIDVVVTASDVAGNTTSINSSKTYNVDANVVVPPARATLKASSDTGSSDSDNITKNTRPVVTLQCISATDKLHLIVDGVEVQVVNCTSAGPIEVTLPNALSDGSHTVTYSRETSAGNVSAPSMPLTLTIDTTAPTGALTTQQATVASPALSGTVNDPTATVVVTINGVDYPAVVAGGIWTLPSNSIAALGDGAYTVKMKFTDIAGNVSVTQGVLTISLPSSPLTPQLPQPGGVGVATPEQNKKKSHSSLAGTGDNLYLIIGVVCLTIAAGSIGLYRLRRRVR
ncbi:BspA family leucine-rich repeat surface protein [Candidatus Saccharibacteria bacterium oral taxon 955]|nr:BspA family leucine-rich repeat surface protein [Candidatus Saccharibacteria bacterium oral taxon 955]